MIDDLHVHTDTARPARQIFCFHVQRADFHVCFQRAQTAFPMDSFQSYPSVAKLPLAIILLKRLECRGWAGRATDNCACHRRELQPKGFMYGSIYCHAGTRVDLLGLINS
jgi:hypothetical protein